MKPQTQKLILLFCFLSSAVRSQVNFDFENAPIGVVSAVNSIPNWSLSSAQNSSLVLTQLGNTVAGAACNTTPAVSYTPGSSEVWVVQTPLINVPQIGSLSHSPLGGTRVLKVHDTVANTAITSIRSSTISVGNQTNLFELAIAGSIGGQHGCCDQGCIKVDLYYLSTNSTSFQVSNCTGLKIVPNVCGTTVTSFSLAGSINYTGWQVKQIDLSPYTGMTVFFVITVAECSFGDHFSSVYLDACLKSQNLQFVNGGILPKAYCFSTTAQIAAPSGNSSYTWYAPVTSLPLPINSSISSLTISSPIPNSVYTVVVNSNYACVSVYSINLANLSTVSIANVLSKGSCTNGSSGAATVIAQGNTSGYTYNWINATNAVISTNSVVQGIPPGNYTVSITGVNVNGFCNNTVSNTLTIPASASTASVSLYDFCGGSATIITDTANTYQWYVNTAAISGATNATYFYPNVLANSVVSVVKTKQGCIDTVQYLLNAIHPGTLSLSSTSACAGYSTAVVSFSLAGSGLPAASYSLGQVFANGQWQISNNGSGFYGSVGNVIGGQTYSMVLGLPGCKLSGSVSIGLIPPTILVSLPSNSVLLCSQQTYTTVAASSSSLISGTYSWSPSPYITGQLQSAGVSITPPFTIGGASSTTYQVLFIPNANSCPSKATLTINTLLLPTPTLQPVPALCANAAPVKLTATPSGGVFGPSSVPHPFSTGSVIPSSNCGPGVYPYVYSYANSGCVVTTTGNVTLLNTPTVNTWGSNGTVCKAELRAYWASGADSYTWSTGAVEDTIYLAPTANLNLSVTGANNLTQCENTATLSILVAECLHIEESIYENDLTIFPNPSRDFFSIQLSAEFQVRVVDAEGTEVLKATGNESTVFRLGHLNAGIYALLISSGEKIYKKKLVLER